MNTKFILASVFAAMSGLAGVTNTAKAGSDIHINLGFGLRPAPIVVAPSYCAPVAPVVEYRYAEPRGYWKEVVVKTWVPARWVVAYVAHGREFRRFEPAHFAYNTNRVWVDLGREHGRDHDRDDYRRG